MDFGSLFSVLLGVIGAWIDVALMHWHLVLGAIAIISAPKIGEKLRAFLMGG